MVRVKHPVEAYLVGIDSKHFVKGMYAAACDFEGHMGCVFDRRKLKVFEIDSTEQGISCRELLLSSA